MNSKNGVENRVIITNESDDDEASVDVEALSDTEECSKNPEKPSQNDNRPPSPVPSSPLPKPRAVRSSSSVDRSSVLHDFGSVVSLLSIDSTSSANAIPQKQLAEKFRRCMLNDKKGRKNDCESDSGVGSSSSGDDTSSRTSNSTTTNNIFHNFFMAHLNQMKIGYPPRLFMIQQNSLHNNTLPVNGAHYQ